MYDVVVVVVVVVDRYPTPTASTVAYLGKEGKLYRYVNDYFRILTRILSFLLIALSFYSGL